MISAVLKIENSKML